jgi:uncharacterized cupin superfamily protein
VATTPPLVCFDQSVAAQLSTPPADRVLTGTPRLTLWNHYSDPGQRFFAGVWAATRGCWRIHYTEHEFCHLLSGRVAIRSDQGERWEFGPGDSFVVPSGFVGTWEVLEDCRKLYAIHEAAA